jgi:serine phosphatase RsbU (regulator of sigma subunit)
VTEARDREEEEFTKERLFDALIENRHRDSRSIVEIIVDRVREFSGLETQADDITLVIVRVDTADKSE